MYRRNGTDQPLPGDPLYEKLITPMRIYSGSAVSTCSVSADVNPGKNEVGKKNEEKRIMHEPGCPCRDCPSSRKVTVSSTAFPEVPQETNILQVPRIGDNDRDIILERLREAYGSGYLSLSEQEARMDAALKALTGGQLDLLVQDLPVPKKTAVVVVVPEKEEENQRIPLWVPVLTALMAGSSVLTANLANLATAGGEMMLSMAVILAVIAIAVFIMAAWQRISRI